MRKLTICHMNTKHPHKRLDVRENSFRGENNESETSFEDETSFFKVDMVHGEPVFL